MALGIKKKEKLGEPVLEGVESETFAGTEEPVGFEDLMENRRKRRIKPGVVIAITAFLLLTAFFVAVFRFNFLDIRDKHLRNVLEQVPIVNSLLPSLTVGDTITTMPREELEALYETLKADYDALNVDYENTLRKNETYAQEILRLSAFEESQLTYKEDKEAFDRLVGLNDPEAFRTFYEQISPENAEAIYREVVGTIQENQALRDYVKTYEAMDEKRAARIFEELVGTDLDLVVMVLNNINKQQRAEIIAAMSAESGAMVTKRMAPEGQ